MINHGTAKLKEDLRGIFGGSETLIKKGEAGPVTAYSPDKQIFTVMFPQAWITFTETEKEFLNRCEYIPNGKTTN